MGWTLEPGQQDMNKVNNNILLMEIIGFRYAASGERAFRSDRPDKKPQFLERLGIVGR
jgi:hypothetical protein